MQSNKLNLVSLLALAFIYPFVVNATSCSLATHRVGKKPCGERAYLEDGTLVNKPYYQQYYDTAAECSQLILNRPEPYTYDAFSYNETSKLCIVYNGPHLGRQLGKHKLVPNNNSDTLWWVDDCFTCDRSCPSTSNGNLLDNSGFELSKAFASPWLVGGQRASSIVSPGYKSSNAFKCSAKTRKKPFCTLSQFIRVCYTELYLLTFDMKIVDSNGSLSLARKPSRLNVATYSQFLDLNLYFHRVESSDWQRYTYAIEPFSADPPTTEYLFQAFLYWISSTYDGSTSAYFDNIELQKAPSTLKSVTDNLLQNSGFETGDLAPWAYPPKKFANVTVISPGLTEGDYAVHYRIQGPHEFKYTDLHQDFDTSLAKPYLVSFDWKYSYYSEYTQLEVHTFDPAAGAGPGKNLTRLTLSGPVYENYGDGLHTFRAIFTATSNRTRLSIVIGAEAYKKGGAVDYYFDNFQVRQVEV